MKPLEALDDAIKFGILMDSLRFKKPGAIIEKLKPEVREALKKLTSDEAKNVRIDKDNDLPL